MGPVASQEAIKMLGTNGGGFFNANSAHPFENPTPLVNFLQMLSIFLIPGGLCIAFGCIVGDERQGWAVFAAMTLIFVSFAIGAITFEQQGNPLLATVGDTEATGVRTSLDRRQHGRQGSALRHRRFRPVRHHHHRPLVRCRQCDARLVHAARRRHRAAGT
jgi:K+-transporting ATPase ATPase A chain